MSDLTYIATWWSVLFVIGIINLPISSIILKRFSDQGYGFSKTIGVLISSFIIFLLAITKLIPFTLVSILGSLFALLVVNILLVVKNPKIISNVKKSKRIIALQELLFIFGLGFWSFVRAHNPDINGLEKFMDYGFVNSILRSNYLPPADMWFAGESINYYWFGHFYAALLTKLSNIPSSVTYNLMIATIAGLTLTSAFSISSTLIKSLKLKIGKTRFPNWSKTKPIVAAGMISAILLTFGGNFHTPYYVAKDGIDNYWFPDATRFIGYNPETNDKTIHEFPLYSFVVSDLHAHLNNLPFVLLYIAVLWSFFETKEKKRNEKITKSAILGFLMGIFFMTNTWDVGNYFLVTLIGIGMFSLLKNKLKPKLIISYIGYLLIIITFTFLTLLPFYLNFTSIAQGIDFVNARTPIWQLGILWGFPLSMTLILILFAKKFIKLKKSADIFVLSLFFASWILIIIPEIIFVKDIYIASHHRANTMFKLTYQAYVMFYLSSGYLAIRVLSLIKARKFKFPMALFFSTIFALTLIYPIIAIGSFYNDLKNYKGLKGDTWAAEKHPEQYQVIEWFSENIDGQPVILEAPGDSYTEFNLISAYTGLPTVSGWFVHEWLWRGEASFPQERVDDIGLIYNSDDVELTKKLLEKYNVEYIIVGPNEFEKFPDLIEQKFEQIGNSVFAPSNISVYQLK